MTARYLLDTCVVSELPRPLPNQEVLAWLAEFGDQSAVSAVTLGEIAYGVAAMPVGRRQASLRTWFERLRRDYHANILVADEAVFLEFGRLSASLEALGRPQEDFDLLIAGTARVHDLTLVTRNTKHFADTGVGLLNPWLGK